MQATIIYGTQKGNVILVVGDTVKHFDNLTDAIVAARQMTGVNPKVVSR